MDVPYVPCYCEENAYKIAGLAVDGRLAGDCSPYRSAYVVIVTNRDRACAHFFQKAAAPDSAALWDYHVYVACVGSAGAEIWDPSSRLDCPSPASEYLERTYDEGLDDRYAPAFRLAEAGRYLGGFSSDRRHMRRADGSWLRPPPDWPAIRGLDASSPHELARLLDLDDGAWGEPHSLRDLVRLLDAGASLCPGDPTTS